MDIQIESAIIGGLIGSGLAGWISYLCTKYSIKKAFELAKLQERNKAAADFRAIFTEIIRNLNGIAHPEDLDNDFIYKLIKKNITEHEKAYIRFKPYLSDKEIINFDIAWKRYSNPSSIIKKENPDPLLDYYAEGKTIEQCITPIERK